MLDSADDVTNVHASRYRAGSTEAADERRRAGRALLATSVALSINFTVTITASGELDETASTELVESLVDDLAAAVNSTSNGTRCVCVLKRLLIKNVGH